MSFFVADAKIIASTMVDFVSPNTHNSRCLPPQPTNVSKLGSLNTNMLTQIIILATIKPSEKKRGEYLTQLEVLDNQPESNKPQNLTANGFNLKTN